MLLFNEIMYNNATDGAEYIEIYNPTEQAIILPALYLYKMYKDGAIYNTTILQNESPSTPPNHSCQSISLLHEILQQSCSET